MLKEPIGINVLQAAMDRIHYTFETFERVYLSFSAGKDSTIMLHLAADKARQMGVKFGDGNMSNSCEMHDCVWTIHADGA